MARFFIFCVVLLSLVGCGGGEFTASAGDPAGGNAAGMPDVGDAGEASVGGAGSSSNGGRDAQGGSVSQGGSSAASGTGGNQAGAAGSPPVMVCNPQDTQCSNGSFQTCRPDGSGWSSKTCDFVCNAQTGCSGACQPGAKQCSGADSQTCDKDGKWVTSTTCLFMCGGAGVCGGQCVPGSQQCSGNDAQLCDPTGTWTTSQTCQYTCNFSNDTASCGGTCIENTHQCSGQVPQTCTASEWTSGAQCKYVCTNGTCGGECVPGTQKCGPSGGVQTCSTQGSWLAEGPACTFTCTDGACSGSCVPNAACPDDGNACTNDVCNAQGTACTHPPKTDGLACGSSASSVCDSPDTCQAGVCQQNLKPINTPCTDDQNVCTVDTCNGSGTCNHLAAPANTVCRSNSCTNDTLTSQATCGGATSCPAATTTSCFGACDAGGLVCLNTAPQKLDDVAGGAILATDNDAQNIYASVRTSAGVAQIIAYTKSSGAKTVLYQTSNSTDWIYSIIVAGTSLYFGETFWNPGLMSGQISRISTSGALQTATSVSSQATFGFAKNTTRVYWSDARMSACVCASPASTRIFSTPIGSTTPTTFSFAFNGVEISNDIEVDDTYLYVWRLGLNYDGGPSVSQTYEPSLVRYNLTNPATDNTEVQKSYYVDQGITYDLTSSYNKMPGLTKTGSLIYGNVNIGYTTGTILTPDQNNLVLAVTPTGTILYVTKTSPIGLTQNFVADSQYVYLEDMRVPTGGGSTTYWTNHELASGTLSMDASSMYFGSYGYWNAMPYANNPDVVATALYKVVKP